MIATYVAKIPQQLEDLIPDFLCDVRASSVFSTFLNVYVNGAGPTYPLFLIHIYHPPNKMVTPPTNAHV
jgi:hypothetical protein